MRIGALNILPAKSAAKLVVSMGLMAAVLFSAMPAGADGDVFFIPVPFKLMTFKSDWSAGATYAAHDVVFYNGSSWFSLVGSNTGNAPDASSAEWTMLMQKGDQGPLGPEGPPNPNVLTDSTNTALGHSAFNSGSTGNNNTAIGAESLHSNATGYDNTAAGYRALNANTTGFHNTAAGYCALERNTTGHSNAAAGEQALNANTTGYYNVAVGSYALHSNTTGGYDIAIGGYALQDNTTGNCNTAIGVETLLHNTTGNYNTVLGHRAGRIPGEFTGRNNIYIGSDEVIPDTPDESYTIRIGTDENSNAIIAGIHGSTSSGGAGVLASWGKLGTVTSSVRYKEEVRDMGDASSALMQLRPVTFYYRREYADGPRILQYGLIAEEVAEVYPGLVAYDPARGEPETVYYRLVNAMLLNEVQKQQQRINSLEERLPRLEALLDRR